MIVLLAFLLCSPSAGEELPQVRFPSSGPLVLAGSCRLAPGEYLRPVGVGQAAIVLEGLKDVELSLEGVKLWGGTTERAQNQASGTAVRLVRCERVKLRGGTLSGFKLGVEAQSCKEIELVGLNFEKNFTQRLRSKPTQEDELDWLWPHKNDAGEWAQNYGAAIAWTDCVGGSISECRARKGQNGLLLTRCSQVRVYDNDFSFLSGWGVALYRSSDNLICRNSLDYCVRGYSHERYWRGQDSAAILLFERSCRNVLAYNSATHSGDGIFLFAGRDIVEGEAAKRGEQDAGGSDGNLFLGNDLSYAVANGLEATFSKDNRAIDNLIRGGHQHGVWGGYSRGLVLIGNRITDTLGPAISIEHGQQCLIARNLIERNTLGIELWWDEDPEFVGGPFGQRFDTSSRDHILAFNAFDANVADLQIQKTPGLGFWQNVYPAKPANLTVERFSVLGGTPQDDARSKLTGLGGFGPSGTIRDSSVRLLDRLPPQAEELLELKPPALPGRRLAVGALDSTRIGLASIVMGEWGPWDWPSGESAPPPPVAGGLLSKASWKAAWFSWSSGPDPRSLGKLEEWRSLADQALHRSEVNVWTDPYAGQQAIRERVGTQRFGLVATARVKLDKGRYRLNVISDDGVRLLVDEVALIEDWSWHAAKRDSVDIDLAEGEHDLWLEYFQIDGAMALSVELESLDPD
jgi:hypothetical protein